MTAQSALLRLPGTAEAAALVAANGTNPGGLLDLVAALGRRHRDTGDCLATAMAGHLRPGDPDHLQLPAFLRALAYEIEVRLLARGARP